MEQMLVPITHSNMNSGFPDDVLPPESDYDSRKAVFDHINSWARPRGYAIITGRSSKTSNRRVKVTFTCDKNKALPSTLANQIHRIASQQTECLFSVIAKESLDRTIWTLRHCPDQKFSKHNHLLTTEAAVYQAHSQLPDEDITIIANLTIAGITP
jgi:hypothetical protein